MEKTLEHNADYNHYAVYEWSVYPRHSVLAGQDCKRFLDAYDTEAEAKAAHPELADDEVGYRSAHNTFDHLPDGDDDEEARLCQKDAELER